MQSLKPKKDGSSGKKHDTLDTYIYIFYCYDSTDKKFNSIMVNHVIGVLLPFGTSFNSCTAYISVQYYVDIYIYTYL